MARPNPSERRARFKPTLMSALIGDHHAASLSVLFQTGETAYGRPIVDGRILTIRDGLGFITLPAQRRHCDRDVSRESAIQRGSGWYPIGSAMSFRKPRWRIILQARHTSPMRSRRWASRTSSSSWRPADSSGRSRVRIAGGFADTEMTRSDSWSVRLCIFPARTGGTGSTGRFKHRKSWSRAISSAPPLVLHYTRPMPGGSWSSSFAGPGAQYSTGHNLEFVPGGKRYCRSVARIS